MSATATRKHTIKEMETEFKLSRSKIYKLINEGALIVVKIGEKSLVINADEWLASLPRGVMAMPKGCRRALDDRRSGAAVTRGAEQLDI